ncbi:MAG: hypothetical protein FJX77_00575, partial [Armatimonadetes bacterium]|nr:hypothetical protein [Armatimonadota bacterium]
MDRSFLSQPEVVAASRRFVCIRPLTYEDRAAQAFLRGLLVGRSGEVENTTCCLLSPDGKDPLTRPARSFQQIYRDAPEMAEWMNRVADEYAAWRRHQKQANRSASSLPVVTGVRLGLATAAADDQPLAVLYNPPGSDRRLESRLAGLAW